MPKLENINLRVDLELKRELYAYAKLKKQNLSDFLNTEIISHLKLYFVRCPKCNKSVFDKRSIPAIGSVDVKCGCGEVFNVEF
jgi:uncharacterized protein with PIN domain